LVRSVRADYKREVAILPNSSLPKRNLRAEVLEEAHDFLVSSGR
jgi:hypothetical protein